MKQTDKAAVQNEKSVFTKGSEKPKTTVIHSKASKNVTKSTVAREINKLEDKHHLSPQQKTTLKNMTKNHETKIVKAKPATKSDMTPQQVAQLS